SLQHGQFRRWLNSQIGISPATAQRWMRLADLEAKCLSLKHLTLDAAYALTARDATSEIITTVTNKAAAGETVPVAMVKEMIGDVRHQRQQAEAIEGRKKRRARMTKRKREQLEREERERAAEQEAERARQNAAAERWVAALVKLDAN